MRLFPNMTVMAPGDEADVAPMLQFALGHKRPGVAALPKPTWKKWSAAPAPVELARPRSTSGRRRRARRLRHPVPRVCQGGRAPQARGPRNRVITPVSQAAGPDDATAGRRRAAGGGDGGGSTSKALRQRLAGGRNAARLDTRHVVRLGIPTTSSSTASGPSCCTTWAWTWTAVRHGAPGPDAGGRRSWAIGR